MRIAYFVNSYPAISHSFIRREIHALEERGITVLRFALRGWNEELIDEIDEKERVQTSYVLQKGIWQLALMMIRVLLTTPLRFIAGFSLARMVGRRSGNTLLYLAYLGEACVLRYWFDKENIEHCHGHFGTNPAAVLMLLKEIGGPNYSFTVHGPLEFDAPFQLGLDEKVARARFVVAISDFAKSQLCRWVNHAHWGRIFVVRCGLENAYFEKERQCVTDTPTLVCVGRLDPQKGQLLLISAVRVLIERNVSVRLRIVGGGDMREELQDLVEEYGLAEHIKFTGAVSLPSLQQEIVNARALVLPSFGEGLPMVIMEAMALYRPVISTYIAGIPELVRPKENGWLVPSGSVSELANAMEEALTLPVAELDHMGMAGFSLARERHSVDDLADKLAQLIEKPITDKRIAA